MGDSSKICDLPNRIWNESMSKYSDVKRALAGLTLGQKSSTSNQYDASLLQPVPRSLNRDDLVHKRWPAFLGLRYLDDVRTFA